MYAARVIQGKADRLLLSFNARNVDASPRVVSEPCAHRALAWDGTAAEPGRRSKVSVPSIPSARSTDSRRP